jgi:hypothetical protein
MRRINRWLAILVVVMAPLAALAQDGGGARDRGQPPGIAADDDRGLAMPRFGGDERQSRPQRVILVFLATLLAVTVVFGLGTVAYAFRDQWRRRHRP